MHESSFEGEHRTLRMFSQRSHATRHPTMVASKRLDQNAAVVDLARQTVQSRTLFSNCWRSWKLLAAPRTAAGRSRHQGFRVPKQVRKLRRLDVVKHVYRVAPLEGHNKVDLTAFFKTGVSNALIGRPDAHAMVTDYISKSLHAGAVYSVVVADEDDWICDELTVLPTSNHESLGAASGDVVEARHEGRCLFKVLNKNVSVAKRVTSVEDERVDSTFMQIQKYERLNVVSASEVIHIFANSPPTPEYLPDLAPWISWRKALRRCTPTGQSDHPGCLSYTVEERVDHELTPLTSSFQTCDTRCRKDCANVLNLEKSVYRMRMSSLYRM